MRFEFATATRILFGEGVSREVPAAAAAMGRRALVVTGASAERAAPLVAGLESAGVACARLPVSGEPTLDLVAEGAAQGRGACDVVIAMGGGSAIDAGKAIAAMITNPGEPLDYLEVIGRGRPLENVSAPFIAVPTTAGTGSEVTRNAVLASHAKGVKASLRGAGMLPRLAVVDPELTLDLPRPITASTGMDALTQLIEPYVSARANPMVDMFCVEGIRRGAAALPRAWQDGNDREARREMAWVSLLGGLSLANAGLGAAHGFAAVLGGTFHAPHGAICAAMIPHVIEVNVRALRSRAPQNPALARYEEIARIVTGCSHATPEDGARWVADLSRRLEIPPLRAYGVSASHVPDLVENAARASSMKANPIVPTTEELREMVSAAI